MLNAYYGEWNTENSHQLVPMSRDELNELVDRFEATRNVSSYRGGCSGDHAWIIVCDHGFNLEVYFGEGCHVDKEIHFVLYGPCLPGERGDIYDGRGLDGTMTTQCLKSLLAAMDDRASPVASVREFARDVSVIKD